MVSSQTATHLANHSIEAIFCRCNGASGAAQQSTVGEHLVKAFFEKNECTVLNIARSANGQWYVNVHAPTPMHAFGIATRFGRAYPGNEVRLLIS